MTYKVVWRKLPGKALISSESYETLDAALVSADIAMIGGPGPVEITVIDNNGNVHFLKVVDIV
jgi:hypothetical protein